MEKHKEEEKKRKAGEGKLQFHSVLARRLYAITFSGGNSVNLVDGAQGKRVSKPESSSKLFQEGRMAFEFDLDAEAEQVLQLLLFASLIHLSA